jgi:hypothetical protein
VSIWSEADPNSQRGRLASVISAARHALDAWAVVEVSGREAALVRTKLDEAELWLARVTMRDRS